MSKELHYSFVGNSENLNIAITKGIEAINIFIGHGMPILSANRHLIVNVPDVIRDADILTALGMEFRAGDLSENVMRSNASDALVNAIGEIFVARAITLTTAEKALLKARIMDLIRQ